MWKDSEIKWNENQNLLQFPHIQPTKGFCFLHWLYHSTGVLYKRKRFHSIVHNTLLEVIGFVPMENIHSFFFLSSCDHLKSALVLIRPPSSFIWDKNWRGDFSFVKPLLGVNGDEKMGSAHHTTSQWYVCSITSVRRTLSSSFILSPFITLKSRPLSTQPNLTNLNIFSYLKDSIVAKAEGTLRCS